MKKLFVVALSVLFSLSLAAAAFAEGQSENSATAFFRKLFRYPVKAVQKTGEMTEHTLNNTGEKVIAPIVRDPGASIPGTAETIGQTAAETVAVPVEAAQDDKPAA